MLNMLTTSVGIAVFTIGAAALASEADGRQVRGGVRVGDGATYASRCAYQYGRWQATRSANWRDLYHVCASASDVGDEPLD
jgi:hypothetical protein